MPLPAKLPVAVSGDTVAAPASAEAAKPLLHISSREVPPGGMSYKIAELSERAPAICWVGPFNDSETLLNEVSRRCRANGVAPPSLAAVEDQVCSRCPPGYCRGADGRSATQPGAFSLGLAEVISGTKALLGWLAHGSVPDAQIATRSHVCNACPLNRPITGCTGCAATALHAVINRIVVKPLPSDAVLHACLACKCSLRAKTRMRLEDVQGALSAESRACLWDQCWITAEEGGETLRSDPRV